MRKHTDNTQEKNLRFTFVHIVIIGAIFFIFYAMSVCYSQKKIEYQEKLIQQKQIEQEIEILEKDNRKLKSKIAFLNTDEGVEGIAREKLGLIKPKEIAFVVISTQTPLDTSGEKVVEYNKAKTTGLSQEIRKESLKKEGWLGRILNRLWGK